MIPVCPAYWLGCCGVPNARGNEIATLETLLRTEVVGILADQFLSVSQSEK